jgi:hypothetical protein
MWPEESNTPVKKYKRIYMIVTHVDYQGADVPDTAFETEEQAREYMKNTTTSAYTSRDIYPLDVELKD